MILGVVYSFKSETLLEAFFNVGVFEAGITLAFFFVADGGSSSPFKVSLVAILFNLNCVADIFLAGLILWLLLIPLDYSL